MKSELNRLLKPFNKYKETIIFRKMAESLNRFYPTNAIFVEETHGYPGRVKFQSSTAKQNIEREIADLLIVTNNVCNHELRLSFLQAKYKRKPTSNFLRFHGDYFQWELLNDRPLITSTGSIIFPKTILSFTKYKSISSFGIFYHDNQGKIDLLYSIPDTISPLSKVYQNRKHSIAFDFNGKNKCPNSKCHYCSKFELLETCSIDVYEQHLLGGKVGAPVNGNREAVNFIAYQLTQGLRIQKSSKTIIDILKNPVFETVEKKKLDVHVEGNMKMLLINTFGNDIVTCMS